MNDFTSIAGHLAESLRQEKPPIEERDYKARHRQWEQDCIAIGAALSTAESGGKYSVFSVNEFIHACGSTKTL